MCSFVFSTSRQGSSSWRNALRLKHLQIVRECFSLVQILANAITFHHCLMTAKPVLKRFPFQTQPMALRTSLHRLSASLPTETISGNGSKGYYWLELYSFLLEKVISLHVNNPIQTDGWRKGIEIRKRKKTVFTSRLIKDLLKLGDFAETKLADEDLQALRSLERFHSYFVGSIADR